MADITPEDINHAKARQAEVFTNYDYLLRANKIADEFAKEGANGEILMNKIRTLLILQGEWDFEQEVKDHPYGLQIPNLNDNEVSEEITLWLQNQFDSSEYIVMPNNAVGIYKHCWNWIFFKKSDQVVLFKLTWF